MNGLKTRLDVVDDGWSLKRVEVEEADAYGHKDSKTEVEAVEEADGDDAVVDVHAWRQNFPLPCAFCWQNHLLLL